MLIARSRHGGRRECSCFNTESNPFFSMNLGSSMTLDPFLHGVFGKRLIKKL